MPVWTPAPAESGATLLRLPKTKQEVWEPDGSRSAQVTRKRLDCVGGQLSICVELINGSESLAVTMSWVNRGDLAAHKLPTDSSALAGQVQVQLGTAKACQGIFGECEGLEFKVQRLLILKLREVFDEEFKVAIHTLAADREGVGVVGEGRGPATPGKRAEKAGMWPDAILTPGV
ncbi:hypothetical protein AAFF_G00259050 [Aldrovandia affinis]|uniref:Uncharacterized protein n=1 Tax=Aldrovandia affinis TaxID=143900 RepID=A0AAD7WT52_9TELE|nr:hypothetical protein AAFF_G00259050 [Aldrovandia affinis]